VQPKEFLQIEYTPVLKIGYHSSLNIVMVTIKYI